MYLIVLNYRLFPKSSNQATYRHQSKNNINDLNVINLKIMTTKVLALWKIK
ncbi:hypothetical protein ETAE_1693 [Edwardsiella piscicida]|uniref:Uncharacterized protein n=1 Tax=Edwardsiella piscicida TaxID=1263550 RepID=A0AAU8P4I5_EDWPI|nr:hypothetical protein ETAE_1693 [Edwardsiella tarda EIB202]